MMSNKRHMHFTSELKTRSNEDEAFIEGYFVVFNQETELWQGAYEEIAPEAFNRSLNIEKVDVIALDNHDSRVVLGSLESNTLELKVDSYGLYGRVKVDLEDPFAKSAYRKVQTGKVRGCSFGFYPIKEEYSEREDGTSKWRVIDADLLEVSITAFPAYPQTEVAARQKDVEVMKKQKLEQRKKQLKEQLSNG